MQVREDPKVQNIGCMILVIRPLVGQPLGRETETSLRVSGEVVENTFGEVLHGLALRAHSVESLIAIMESEERSLFLKI